MFREGIFPPAAPLLIKKLFYWSVLALVQVKWLIDSKNLPLRKGDWNLYLDIHMISFVRLRRLPNLLRPKTYNDQVKWLMLFAQHADMPLCVDKVLVRAWVAEKIGERYLIPLLKISSSWLEVEEILTSSIGVLKCAHDSGSAYPFNHVATKDLPGLKEKFGHLISRTYGVGKGEWPYESATKTFILERRLNGPNRDSLPPDIKVHCVNGSPTLVHIIADRNQVPKQAFFLPDGRRVFPRVKPHREQIKKFDFEIVREHILPLASTLSSSFAYVRTDFYLSDGNVYFGEMTFFEESGLFQDKNESDDLASFVGIKCIDPRPTLRSAYEG